MIDVKKIVYSQYSESEQKFKDIELTKPRFSINDIFYTQAGSLRSKIMYLTRLSGEFDLNEDNERKLRLATRHIYYAFKLIKSIR